LLPEDPRYIGVAQQTLIAAAPGLLGWPNKVFTVLGGFMAGAGVLMAHFGWRSLPRRLPGRQRPSRFREL
jgi:hypothetical protein